MPPDAEAELLAIDGKMGAEYPAEVLLPQAAAPPTLARTRVHTPKKARRVLAPPATVRVMCGCSHRW